jgi:hypothetical protein
VYAISPQRGQPRIGAGRSAQAFAAACFRFLAPVLVGIPLLASGVAAQCPSAPALVNHDGPDSVVCACFVEGGIVAEL